jgi:hypothetical protein
MSCDERRDLEINVPCALHYRESEGMPCMCMYKCDDENEKNVKRYVDWHLMVDGGARATAK